MSIADPGTHITWTVEFFVPGVTDPMEAYEKMKELKLIPPEGVHVGDKRATCKVSGISSRNESDEREA